MLVLMYSNNHHLVIKIRQSNLLMMYPMIMQFKKKFKLFSESQQVFATSWENNIWKHRHKKKDIYCP
jgi:hypothetical protein